MKLLDAVREEKFILKKEKEKNDNNRVNKKLKILENNIKKFPYIISRKRKKGDFIKKIILTFYFINFLNLIVVAYFSIYE
jgi:hypothetical protein